MVDIKMIDEFLEFPMCKVYSVRFLDGCGWIVESKGPKQLAETIQYVLNNPEEADVMGRKARKKCMEKYSWDAMEKILLKVFKKYE